MLWTSSLAEQITGWRHGVARPARSRIKIARERKWHL
jgi:hypothetical protein